MNIYILELILIWKITIHIITKDEKKIGSKYEVSNWLYKKMKPHFQIFYFLLISEKIDRAFLFFDEYF